VTTAAEIDALIETVSHGQGVISVVARVVGEEAPRYAHAPDERHYAASIMKLPVLIAAERLVERDLLDLARPVEVHAEFDSRNPGRRFEMDEEEDSDPETWAAAGHSLPLSDLVHRMVTVSGNLATNLVLEQVGFEEVAAVLADAGCSSRTAIPRMIEDYPAREIELDNLITANDLALVLVALAEGRLARAAATAECERILRAQTYRDGIPAGLPADVVVGNKTGWVDAVNHDVALVRPADGQPVVIAVFCSTPGTPEEREAGIARITEAVWPLVASGPDESASTMTR
jgi:beta-lactamase class A